MPWLRQLMEGRIYLGSRVHYCGERHGSKQKAWWPGQEAESSPLQWRHETETELGKDRNHSKLAPSKVPPLNASTSSPKQPYQLGTQYSNTRVDGRHFSSKPPFGPLFSITEWTTQKPAVGCLWGLRSIVYGWMYLIWPLLVFEAKQELLVLGQEEKQPLLVLIEVQAKISPRKELNIGA